MTKPMPASIVASQELNARYPMTCVCGAKHDVRPSWSMQGGMNSGHATCPACKVFLHLSLNEAGDAMECEPFDDYLAREHPPLTDS